VLAVLNLRFYGSGSKESSSDDDDSGGGGGLPAGLHYWKRFSSIADSIECFLESGNTNIRTGVTKYIGYLYDFFYHN
jgi:hypothetical protein